MTVELNQEQLLLLNRINIRFFFKLFSIIKLPLEFLTGLKIVKLNGDECITSVRLKYLNKNPFRSTYFAVLSMAAELSTGAIALLAAEGRHTSVAKIITSMKADFVKKATGRTQFTCSEGQKLLNSNTVLSALIVAAVTTVCSSYITTLRMEEKLYVVSSAVEANTEVIRQVRDQQLVHPYELEALRSEIAKELAMIQNTMDIESNKLTDLRYQMDLIKEELKQLIPKPGH